MKSASVCLMLLMICEVRAADWPTWRGAERDGVSSETGLLQDWPEGGPKKLWTATEAGLGYSSFAVIGERLYTMGADESNEFLMAFDAISGEKIWEVSVGELLEDSRGDGPRSTPAVSGNQIVAIGGRGGLVCVSADEGSLQWSADMVSLGGKIPHWGYSESPLIDGDKVLCTPGGENGTVAAYDLQSGKKLWQSADVTELAHYSSVIAVEHFGQHQYIQLTKDKVFGLDTGGQLLWQADWPGKTAVVPTPIYHEGRVYVTSGYGVGCMMVTVDRDNHVEKIYDNKVMKNHHGGAIRLGTHIYGYSDSVGWICQDMLTGELVWNEKRKLGKGAMAYAEGRLYCLDESSGTCVLAAASPDGWQEHGRFELEPQSEERAPKGKVWTHPVIANGRLYLRDQNIICCYDITAR